MKYLLLILSFNLYAETLPEGKEININTTNITSKWNKEEKAYYNYEYIDDVSFVKVDSEELLAKVLAYCTEDIIYLVNTKELERILKGCSNIDYENKKGGFVD
jgi:hypothetical protein